MEVVAVDWSGAATGSATHIWLAHVVDGELVALRNGRTRREVVDDLVALRARTPGRTGGRAGLLVLVPGLVPARAVLRHRGRALGDGRAEGGGLAGRVRLPVLGAPRAAGGPSCRRTSGGPRRSIAVGGISPKSTFQIGGAGAVGTGSIRGMPHLRRLRAAGFSIWPFDPPSPWQVLEIYPRLLHRAGPQEQPPGAGALRRRRRRGRSPPAFATTIVESEDAFDAAISALVMGGHLAELVVAAPVHRSAHAAGGRRVASP